MNMDMIIYSGVSILNIIINGSTTQFVQERRQNQMQHPHLVREGRLPHLQRILRRKQRRNERDIQQGISIDEGEHEQCDQ